MWSGYIYKIHCNITGEDYYGSTDQDMQQRLRIHKCMMDTAASQIFERDDWFYEIMEEVDYIIKVDLYIREKYYIKNYPCINIKIPFRTKEENREYHRLHAREYRIVNPDYVTRQNNHKNIKHKCLCGGKYTNSGKARHIKSKKHKRYIDNN